MVDTLPFHPWWHHPNHNYVGKHRGTYQFRGWFIRDGKVNKPLPYGVRDIMIRPYLEDQSIGKLSQQLSGSGFILPQSQIIEFTSEEFAPLTGDDKAIRLNGKRDWNISMTVENVNPQVFSMLFGDQPCSQQSRCKATLLSVAVRAKRFLRKVTRPFLRRVGN